MTRHTCTSATSSDDNSKHGSLNVGNRAHSCAELGWIEREATELIISPISHERLLGRRSSVPTHLLNISKKSPPTSTLATDLSIKFQVDNIDLKKSRIKYARNGDSSTEESLQSNSNIVGVNSNSSNYSNSDGLKNGKRTDRRSNSPGGLLWNIQNKNIKSGINRPNNQKGKFDRKLLKKKRKRSQVELTPWDDNFSDNNTRKDGYQSDLIFELYGDKLP